MKNKYIFSLSVALSILIFFIVMFKLEIFTISSQKDPNFDYSVAVQTYLDEYNEGDPEAILLRVRQLETDGDYAKSKEYAHKLIEVDPSALSYHTLANQYTYLGEHDEALKWREKAVESASNSKKNDFLFYLSITQLLFDFNAAFDTAKKGALLEKKLNDEIGNDSHQPMQKYVEQLQKYRDNIGNDPVFAIKEIVSGYYIPFYQIKVEFINNHFHNKMITTEEKEALLALIRKESIDY